MIDKIKDFFKERDTFISKSIAEDVLGKLKEGNAAPKLADVQEYVAKNKSIWLRGCTGKKKYHSKSSAKGDAKCVSAIEKLKKIKAYKCNHCDQWHVGTALKTSGANLLSKRII